MTRIHLRHFRRRADWMFAGMTSVVDDCARYAHIAQAPYRSKDVRCLADLIARLSGFKQAGPRIEDDPRTMSSQFFAALDKLFQFRIVREWGRVNRSVPDREGGTGRVNVRVLTYPFDDIRRIFKI